MNVAFMRFADRVLGTLACHLLTGHRRTLGRLFARCPVDPPRAILVIKLLGLGSVLLSGPTQRALKQAYPGAKLFFLTFAENRWVAEALGLADEVWTISSKGVGSLLRDYRQFRRRCRQERIDFCLDLEFFSRLPVVLTYQSGAPRRFGFYERGRSCGDLFTDRGTYNPHRHVAEIFGSLAESAGAPCDAQTMVAPRIAAEDLASAREKLTGAGVTPDTAFVALAPNVSDLGAELRRWPQERWVQLADRLWSERGLSTVIIGGPSDVSYVDEILAQCAPETKVCSLAGKTSLGEAAAIIKLAGVLAACDSGPAALAECLGTPLAVLFSTESPTLFGPRSPSSRVLYQRTYCSPCLSVYNEKIVDFVCDNRCMLQITVDEVLRAVLEIVRPASGEQA